MPKLGRRSTSCPKQWTCPHGSSNTGGKEHVPPSICTAYARLGVNRGMSTAATGPQVRAGTYAGLFIITMTTLAYEVALTRIFSVTMWYHFAFVAISLALFGMTAGALIVHFRPQWFTGDRVKRQMFVFSLLYAVAMVAALVAQLAVPFRVEMNAVAIFSVIYTCAVVAVPFTLAGVVVCLALTRFPGKENRLYAADLIGAGLGCLLLVAGFAYFDGLSLVIFVAAIAAGGALLFALDAGVPMGAFGAVVVTAALLIGALGNNDVEPFVRIIYGKDGIHEDALDFSREEWNAFSRVTVSGDSQALGPSQIPGGLSPLAERELTPSEYLIRQLKLTIDGTAATPIYEYDGTEQSTRFLRYDVSNLHYYGLEEDPDMSAAVVGVGGGKDVLSALQFGAEDVVGIEINGNILDMVNGKLGDFSGHVDEDPRVDYVVDEARSWLARTDRRFDSIQISLIDSWAATAAGAFALTENSLYTVEAWDMFLDRLEPGGVLSTTRFYTHPEITEPVEVYRTAVLAAEVLNRRGVENPRDHILIYEGPDPSFVSLGTVMVSAEPFDAETRRQITEAADRLMYSPVLTPTEARDPLFEAIVQPGGPGPALSQFDADMSAPTDDRPFFFQMASFGDVLGFEGIGGDSNSHFFKGVYTLFFLGLGVLLLAGVCIGGPLLHMGRRTSHRGRWPHYLYFCGIGLGFMLVEVSQLMRLSTFLGHPTYALTVVLFTVLLFSGLGSRLVERLAVAARPQTWLGPLVVLLGVVVAFGLLTPSIIASQASATTPVRILVSVAILAPLSLAMGMPFALGMRAASADGAPTAFLWGINGATSVVSSVFAMVIAVFWGITMTLLAGFAAYVLATGSMFVLVRRLRGAPAPDAEVRARETAPGDGDGAHGKTETASEPVIPTPAPMPTATN